MSYASCDHVLSSLVILCRLLPLLVISCQACQMLDLKGILRDSEVTKQKRLREQDDNEVDEFYDRTGTIQRKRNVR